ncbi:MAG: DUF3179 domain-containing protein [Betaproteobacteria bacterium]|nr:DUF3179 domain-containing protein [Betaproteobacteria bacterium]
MNACVGALACACAIAVLGAAPGASARPILKNGFDVSGALVPANEILEGGPPKDGIPAIDSPKFVPAAKARALRGNDRVLGLVWEGIAKAYPIRILNWHELVNDRLGEERVLVSYCPLCGTGVAYRSSLGGRTLTFGVSGLLYNSDVLFYDRETQSLWSQFLDKAISGPLKGARLEEIALTHTTWADWRSRHPRTLVLSTDTGFARDYDRDPYAGYERSRALMFPVAHASDLFPAKERVLGIGAGGVFKAYPFTELAKAAGPVTDRVGGRSFVIRFDSATQSVTVSNEHGRQFPAVTAYWFAWYAFHPDTKVFRFSRSAR